MRNYRDLQVWSKAHNLTLELKKFTESQANFGAQQSRSGQIWQRAVGDAPAPNWPGL